MGRADNFRPNSPFIIKKMKSYKTHVEIKSFNFDEI
jgi:hypothetical protein